MRQYKKVTIRFPEEEYNYVKMACVKQRITVKEFFTQSALRSLEEFEDMMDAKAVLEMTDDDYKDMITLEEFEKRLEC